MEIKNSTIHADYIQTVWLFLTHTFDQAEPTFGPLGLGAKQVIILAILDKMDTALALRRTLGAPPSTITNLINDLEKKGLIERQVHPEDRRQHRLIRTAHGEQTLLEGMALVEKSLQAGLGALTEDEREILQKSQAILEKMTRRA
jgi:DNA-binding MarR family transcriptional regulator